jgi:hypothetical protein
MRRPQFSICTLLWLTLAVAAFLGGTGFERERRRREDDAAAFAAKAAQARLQGSGVRKIKKGGFEFTFNSDEERRHILQLLNLDENSTASRAPRSAAPD